MERILIKTYRGFDIEFDNNYERFECVITEDVRKASTSFAAVKAFIDDYKKANQDFEPFFVFGMPSFYSTYKSLKVIGIRKDGAFVAETSEGKKVQISEYDQERYMLEDKHNEPILKDILALEAELELTKSRLNREMKQLNASLKIQTLKQFKTNLLL